jgi:hypothetical protein|tara:strand:+ start:1031 stop:1276 length:246 start_codon:yes stop_codon:yes gene_type:complete
MRNYKPIETAPKDGTHIILASMEDDGTIGESFGPMMWFAEANNPPFQHINGIWMTPNKDMAWSICDPDGAPTHWSKMDSVQ